MATVAIIDYGMGNLHSIAKALEYVGGDQHVMVSHDPEKIRRADRIVFPGVGAIRDCMAEILRLGLDEVIHEVAEQKPFLGVCLGMQALLDSSDENAGTKCLGVIPGRVCRFADPLRDPDNGQVLKVPHMGWNQIHQERPHPLWRDIPQDSRFYFVHSYYVVPTDAEHRVGITDYGMPFASAIARDNVFAMQCHPEKSQHSGLRLLANFLSWNGEN